MCVYKQNLVSVIMPAYNSEKYISDAIESVLQQTYKNFELIIVNDGSTDRTEEILKKYFNRICYISQKNSGAAAARNSGIRASKGEYVAFLDSDDIWMHNTLKLQSDYLNKNPGIGLVYGEMKIFDKTIISNENFAVMLGVPRSEGYIFQDLLLGCLFGMGSLMVRRKILDTVGLFDEALPLGEDYDLWLRIAANHKIGHLPDVLCKYRKHPASLTATNLLHKPWELKVVETALERFPHEKDKISFFKLRRRFERTYFHNGYAAFKQGQYAVARSSFRKSLLLIPFNIRTIIYFIISHFFPRFSFVLIDSFKKGFSRKTEKKEEDTAHEVVLK